MTRRTIGLLAIAILFTGAMSLTISSCDSNSPTNSLNNGGVDRGKGPQVLDADARVAIGYSTNGDGGASVAYNSEGELEVKGLDGAKDNSITTTFDSPISTWQSALDAAFPASGGSLYAEAIDADGSVQARFDLKAEGDNYIAYPTFTSHDGGGKPQYEAIIYDKGTEVCRQTGIPADQHVTITFDASCPPKVNGFKWGTILVNYQCTFTLGLDPCCTYTFTLPNGTVCTGNSIKFIEQNTNGVYVYINTSRIRIGGNTTATTIKAATASS